MSLEETKKTASASNISELAGELSAVIINNMRKMGLEVSIDYMENKDRLVIEGREKRNKPIMTIIRYEISRHFVSGPHQSQFGKGNLISGVVENIDEDFDIFHGLEYNPKKRVYFKPLS